MKILSFCTLLLSYYYFPGVNEPVGWLLTDAVVPADDIRILVLKEQLLVTKHYFRILQRRMVEAFASSTPKI